MSGFGGGLIFDTLQAVTLVHNDTIALNQTTDVLYISAAIAPPATTPACIGLSGGYQDRLLLVVNATAGSIFLEDENTNAAQADRIKTGQGGVALVAGGSIFVHYHIGSLGWYGLPIN